MTRKTYLAAIPAALALCALSAGCGQKAGGSDALAQQKTSVMGSPAPPAVQAQVAAQLAAQRASQQAHQQAGEQAAAQGQPAPK